MTDRAIPRSDAGARSLPGCAYTSDELFQLEQERLFRGGWLCAARGEELPAPGDFRTVEVGGESLLLVRGEDGTARSFYNLCRHRGTRLCTEERGTLPGQIRCPYHAWTYTLGGTLAAARHMQGVEGFRTEDYPLYSAAAVEWEGFLFVNLAAQPEPFAEALAPLLGRFEPWSMASLRRGARIEYDVRANWKLIVENYSECYHCPVIHPALVRLSPADSGRNDLDDGPVLGGYMDLNPQVDTLTADGRRARPPIASLPEVELRRVYYYAVFPNLLLSLHPDYVMAHFLRPESAGRTHVACEWYFPPTVVEASAFDPSDAVEFWDRTNREDWHVNELTQLGVGSRVYTPGPYSHMEGLLWAFDREYERRMAGD